MNSVDSISSWTQLQQRSSKSSSDSLKNAGHKSSVSRAITFGSPLSRDKVHKLVRDQMDSMRCLDRAKWGFDFYSEKATSDSKYEWKKSSSDGRSTDSLNYSFYAYKHPSSFK